MKHLVAAGLFALSLVGAAGCSQPASEDDDMVQVDDALMNEPAQELPGALPIIYDLQPSTPELKLTLERDWARAEVDVLDNIDRTPAWLKTDQDQRPNFVSAFRDGAGSGNCRVKVNLKKFLVRCRWEF
jgi:hypothetical protein